VILLSRTLVIFFGDGHGFILKRASLDERSLYLRHEGHEMKLKFMIPRHASKDQHRLKEKIEKERIEKEEI